MSRKRGGSSSPRRRRRRRSSSLPPPPPADGEDEDEEGGEEDDGIICIGWMADGGRMEADGGGGMKTRVSREGGGPKTMWDSSAMVCPCRVCYVGLSENSGNPRGRKIVRFFFRPKIDQPLLFLPAAAMVMTVGFVFCSLQEHEPLLSGGTTANWVLPWEQDDSHIVLMPRFRNEREMKRT